MLIRFESEDATVDDHDRDDEEKEEPVPLSNRAQPLKHLLKHAISKDSYLMWRPA